LKFSDVEKEMNLLMKTYPEIYTSRNIAVRQAVVNLSGGTTSYARIDTFKKDYDNFSWFVCFAPLDKPKIAVAVLVFQGGWGAYSAPVAKEIIAKYMELEKTYSDYSINTQTTE
jgi:penicillin-binding protein 2